MFSDLLWFCSLCTILHCTVQYCMYITILCVQCSIACTVQSCMYSTVLYVQYCIVCTVQYCMYSTVLHVQYSIACTVQYCMYSTVLHVQYSTAQSLTSSFFSDLYCLVFFLKLNACIHKIRKDIESLPYYFVFPIIMMSLNFSYRWCTTSLNLTLFFIHC